MQFRNQVVLAQEQFVPLWFLILPMKVPSSIMRTCEIFRICECDMTCVSESKNELTYWQFRMRMVTDGYDAGAPLVPYLNWSSYRRSLILLQISLLLTGIVFVVGPYIPLRPILLMAGEGIFIINHPWLKPALEGMMKRIGDGKRIK
jgi:hypothetical protein